MIADNPVSGPYRGSGQERFRLLPLFIAGTAHDNQFIFTSFMGLPHEHEPGF